MKDISFSYNMDTKKIFILTDSRYTEVATEESNGAEVIEPSSSYIDLIKELYNKFNVKRLGFRR